MHRLWKRFLARYLTSSGVAACANLATATVSRLAGLPNWLAITYAYTVSSNTVYQMHRGVTYRTSGSWRKYIKTMGLGAFNGFCAIYIVPYFQSHQGLGFYTAYLGAKTIIGIFNYFLYSYNIFGLRELQEDEKKAKMAQQQAVTSPAA